MIYTVHGLTELYNKVQYSIIYYNTVYNTGQSGDYHCKAATFTHEETSTHTLTVFGGYCIVTFL